MFQNSLDFTPPVLDAIRYLLGSEVAYDKYDQALTWMQDFLLHFTDRYPLARLTPDEANHDVKQLLLDADLEPLSDNLMANQAVAIRLRTEVEQEAGVGRVLVNRFIDHLESWQKHLNDAQITQDLKFIAAYYEELEAEPAADELAGILLERASAYRQANNLAAAIEDYQRALQLKPDFVPALLGLAQIAQSAGLLDVALNYFNRAAQYDPADRQVYRLRGRLQSDLGDYEAAIADFDRVVTLTSGVEYDQTSRRVIPRERFGLELKPQDKDKLIRWLGEEA